MNLESLKKRVQPDTIIDDQEIIAGFVEDWTRRFRGHTSVVAIPRSTSEVAEILKWCSSNQVNVVPQGGNTGMVGGGVPMNGELILSLRRMNRVDFIDGPIPHIIAQAGATLASIQESATHNGWMYGVDFSARESATIGGTIATNAGGNHVIRYGDTRRQVVSLQALTASGKIIGDISGLTKDNTGYHLPSLLCGSEGTLAVITQARLRLWTQPQEKTVVLLGLPSPKVALEIVKFFVASNEETQACEIFFEKGLSLVCQQFGIQPPWPETCSTYLLIEFAGSKGLLDRLNGSEGGEMLKNFDLIAIGEEKASQSRLWRYRSLHTEAISASGIPHKLDITIPFEKLSIFFDEIDSVVEQSSPNAEAFLFGHAGDGNIHVNLIGLKEDDLAPDEAVLEFAASLGGSISAEHGIGRAKSNYLHLRRTPEEISLFKNLKTAFDPTGILNPGVIFPN